jgi:hypothetical protein
MSEDHARLASRLAYAVNHVISGLRMQRDRIAEHERTAPRFLEGEPTEITDLTGTPPQDLDYYVMELGRLQELAKTAKKKFSDSTEVRDALAAFDEAIPHLRLARNIVTHPQDPRYADTANFTSFVRLEPDGGVTYLVDPLHADHDAAEALAADLMAFLRGVWRD